MLGLTKFFNLSQDSLIKRSMRQDSVILHGWIRVRTTNEQTWKFCKFAREFINTREFINRCSIIVERNWVERVVLHRLCGKFGISKNKNKSISPFQKFNQKENNSNQRRENRFIIYRFCVILWATTVYSLIYFCYPVNSLKMISSDRLLRFGK